MTQIELQQEIPGITSNEHDFRRINSCSVNSENANSVTIEPALRKQVMFGGQQSLVLRSPAQESSAEKARQARSKKTEIRRQGVLDKVQDEIDRVRAGEISSFTTNLQLQEEFGISKATLLAYLKSLETDDKQYRSRSLISMGAKNGIEAHGNPFLRIPKERRSEINRKIGKDNYAKGIGIAKFTSEERSNICKAVRARQTPERRREMVAHTAQLRGTRSFELKTGIHGMSTEQRRELGKRNSQRNAELGKGLAGLSNDERSENGKKGGRKGGQRAKELGIGIFGLSSEQRSEFSKITGRKYRARKTLEIIRRNRYEYQGNFFDSKSEVACATLMEKYIPGFQIKVGKTYQVNEGLPISIDFFVNGVFLEYHPILPFKSNNGLGDFDSVSEYEAFKESKKDLPPDQKTAFVVEVTNALANKYIEKRKAAIETSPFKGIELVLVQSPSELYQFINSRFGNLEISPEDFAGEFKSVLKSLR